MNLPLGTRFISVDFTVYNANINLFCVAKLAFEFPAVGGVLPSQVFTTVKLLKYNNPADYLLMATEFIFILYILYYIVEESLEIKIHGWKYFSNLWNLLDLVVIAVRFLSDFNVLTKMFWFVYLQISLSQIGLNVYNLLKVNSLLKALLAKPFLHADFSPLADSSRQLTILSAFNVFVAWIKVFKYLSFNKTMIQLSETLSGVSKSQCLKIPEKVSFNIASEATFTFQVDKSSLKIAKNVYFVGFLKIWSLQAKSVTR